MRKDRQNNKLPIAVHHNQNWTKRMINMPVGIFLIVCTVYLFGTSNASLAQQEAPATAPGSVEILHPVVSDINRLLETAYTRRDPSLGLSRLPSERSKHYYANPMTLLTRDDVPLMAFQERWADDRYEAILTFTCAPGGIIEITTVLRGSVDIEADPNATHELLIRPYGHSRQLQIPAKHIGWVGGSKRSARFLASVPASQNFFIEMQDTSNFQVDLKENGRHIYYNGGTEIAGSTQHLQPLLHQCSGYVPPAPLETAANTPSDSFWTPSAADIRRALQAEVDERLSRMDQMASKCDEVSRTQDPFAAMACIISTVSGINSQTVSITVDSIDLDKCYRMVDGTAYCNYDVNSDIKGSGIAGAVMGLVNEISSEIEAYGWGSFAMVGDSWLLERVYKSCTLGESKINCTYEK